MDEKQYQHLTELRLIHQRRLRVLESQFASFGLYAPPHLSTEIEDIKKQIESIDRQVASNSQTLTIDSQRIIRILFLSTDPKDASRLRLGEELREIQEQLQLAKLREQFELYQRTSVRPTDISRALLDLQPQIVHFSGHGISSGELCFEDQQGKIHSIRPEALAELFEQFAQQINCVILNACYSETQALSISKHIDYVVGMNQAIGDRAAIAFSVGFYQAIGAGSTIEKAYRFGCVQIRLQNIPEFLTPVLVCRKNI
jgi:hypothetical protein